MDISFAINTTLEPNVRNENTMHSDGSYKNVAIKHEDVYVWDGVLMRKMMKTTCTYYQVMWDDGTILARCTKEKEAEALFLDFSGLTVKKLSKAKV